MAQLRDEYGNPVELRDELGNPVQLRDEHGNLVHIKGLATTGTATTEPQLGAPPAGFTEKEEERPPPMATTTTPHTLRREGKGPLETTHHHTLGDVLKDTGHATERTAAGALKTTGHATERAAAGTAAVGGGILGGAALVGGSLVSSVTGSKGTDVDKHNPSTETRGSPSSSTSSSSSSEDDGQGGRRKKKGLTQKIKEKLTGNKREDNKDPVMGQDYASTTTAATRTTTAGPANPQHQEKANPQHQEKKSVMEKIKEKLPGHHGHGQHNH